MHDLKLFRCSEKELEKLEDLVGVYFQNIGMEFEIDKCGVWVIRKGVKVRTEGIVLPNGDVMSEADVKKG